MKKLTTDVYLAPAAISLLFALLRAARAVRR